MSDMSISAISFICRHMSSYVGTMSCHIRHICHMSFVICHMSLSYVKQMSYVCHIPKAMPTQNEVAAAKQRVISALEAHARQSLEAQQATGFASSSLPRTAKSPPSF